MTINMFKLSVDFSFPDHMTLLLIFNFIADYSPNVHHALIRQVLFQLLSHTVHVSP